MLQHKIMNFMGTKQLYIIKSCEQILYFNPIKHHIQFQYNCRGWGLVGGGGGALPPKTQFRLALQYVSCLAKFWPTYVIFTILFRVWSKILSPISNLVLHSTRKTWWEKLPKKMLSGCVLLQSVLLRGDLLNHTVYIQCVYQSTFHCSR